MEKSLVQCGNCLFFRIDYVKNKTVTPDQQRGTCHKRPPVGKEGFARVSWGDYCGEGEAGTCPF